jgi:hypothetical protein
MILGKPMLDHIKWDGALCAAQLPHLLSKRGYASEQLIGQFMLSCGAEPTASSAYRSAALIGYCQSMRPISILWSTRGHGLSALRWPTIAPTI